MIQRVQATKPYSPVKQAAKTTAKAAAAAAVATGGLIYMAKKGKLNPTEGGGVITETIKKGLKVPADFLAGKADKVVGKVLQAEKGSPFVSSILDGARALKGKAEKLELGKKIDTAKDFIESFFNKEKFGK